GFFDLARANPSDARDALWWAISADSAHRKLADLSNVDLSKVDANSWPGILLQFFERHATEDQVVRQAEQMDTHARNWTERSHKCDADFFIGEWHLLTGDTKTSTMDLEQASRQCSPAFVVYGAAKAELGRVTVPIQMH
ncbi:MAG TPA: hypothetical protein VGM17_01045, partial [Rhizomicrobium sp.]